LEQIREETWSALRATPRVSENWNIQSLDLLLFAPKLFITKIHRGLEVFKSFYVIKKSILELTYFFENQGTRFTPSSNFLKTS
jgi:hypothetical protein